MINTGQKIIHLPFHFYLPKIHKTKYICRCKMEKIEMTQFKNFLRKEII